MIMLSIASLHVLRADSMFKFTKILFFQIGYSKSKNNKKLIGGVICIECRIAQNLNIKELQNICDFEEKTIIKARKLQHLLVIHDIAQQNFIEVVFSTLTLYPEVRKSLN